MQVSFLGYDCVVIKSKYKANQQTALSLRTVQDGEPVATATICIPGKSFEEDETVIKDYSENEGILACLIDAGVIKTTGRQIQLNYVVAPIVKVCI